MKESDIKNNTFVINKKYKTHEWIRCTGLMKDSQKGWVPAVIYQGPDRKTGDLTTFVKEIKAFCNEFEIDTTHV